MLHYKDMTNRQWVWALVLILAWGTLGKWVAQGDIRMMFLATLYQQQQGLKVSVKSTGASY